MIEYILYSTFIWVVLLTIYFIFHRFETYFKYNRIYLVVSLFLGLILPVLPSISILSSDSISQTIGDVYVNLPELTIGSTDNLIEDKSILSIGIIIFGLYIIGVIFTLIKLLKSLQELKRIYNKGEKVRINNYSVVVIEEGRTSFSFMNYVFISKSLFFSRDKDNILKHEFYHIDKKHSIDILVVEIFKIVFWFNPLIKIYHALLKEIHEFQVDNSLINSIPLKTYGELLINQLQPAQQYIFANYFINSLIKNRIKMMYKTNTNNKWKYFLSIPLLVLLLILMNSFKIDEKLTNKNLESTLIAQPLLQKSTTTEEYITKEIVPIFYSCNSEKIKEDKVKCSLEKLYNYIYSNLNYPKEAIKKGVEGKVVLRFVVDKEGEIKDAVILKDIGGGCGEAAINVIESLSRISEKIVPTKKAGKNISSYYIFPILFKLKK